MEKAVTEMVTGCLRKIKKELYVYANKFNILTSTNIHMLLNYVFKPSYPSIQPEKITCTKNTD